MRPLNTALSVWSSSCARSSSSCLRRSCSDSPGRRTSGLQPGSSSASARAWRASFRAARSCADCSRRSCRAARSCADCSRRSCKAATWPCALVMAARYSVILGDPSESQPGACEVPASTLPSPRPRSPKLCSASASSRFSAHVRFSSPWSSSTSAPTMSFQIMPPPARAPLAPALFPPASRAAASTGARSSCCSRRQPPSVLARVVRSSASAFMISPNRCCTRGNASAESAAVGIKGPSAAPAPPPPPTTAACSSCS